MFIQSCKKSFKIGRNFSTDTAGKGGINSIVKEKLWKKEIEK